MRRSLVLVCLVGLLAQLVSTAAFAAGRTYTYSAPLQPNSAASWVQQLAVPQFDPGWGTLSSVTLSLTGYVQGTAAFENLDRFATYVIADLSASIALVGPDGQAVATADPTATASARVYSYDRCLDFAGVSGMTFSNLFASCAAEPVVLDASSASSWIGTGEVILSVTESETSRRQYPATGNVVTSFQTFGSADVSITYDYLARLNEEASPIPEMGSLSLAALGGIMWLPALRFRRK